MTDRIDAWKTTEPDYYEEPDEDEEPTGSCDECGVNVYGSDLCDSCDWHRAVAAGEIKP